MLPSGYIPCNEMFSYFDSGVLSASDLEIDALFYSQAIQSGYLFGARNSNSNNSNGQLNFLFGATSYFGCNSARVTIANLQGMGRYIHMYVLANHFELANESQIWSVTGNANSFTGTRNMYINNINNAGTVGASVGARILGFRIKKAGTLVKDYVPAYRESDGTFGLYDLVDDQFVSPLATVQQSFVKQEIAQSQNGRGFFRTQHGELVTEIYKYADTTSTVKCVAIPNDGYRFEKWVDANDVAVSDRQELEINYTTANTLRPVFTPSVISVDEDFCLNYHLAVYKPYYSDDVAYLNVVNASVSEDALQRSTSMITVEDVPSTVEESNIAILYDPKGTIVYQGVIQSIKDNQISCREMLSLFDRDYIFSTSTFTNTNYNVLYGAYYLLTRGQIGRDFSTNDPALSNFFSGFIYSSSDYTYRPSLYEEQNSTVIVPSITDTETANLEDYLLNLANFGIFFGKPNGERLNRQDYIIKVVPYYFRINDALSISDNLENISNIEVTQETQEDNVLVVFNSLGSTLRGMYGVMSDGTVGQYDLTGADISQYIGATKYYGKVILSDDNMNTILAENLSSASLNHKVTFDVQFNRMVTFDMLQIGTPVNFYVGNRLYRSVITAISYDIVANMEDVVNAKITLGNVRTNLTSKLNMGR